MSTVLKPQYHVVWTTPRQSSVSHVKWTDKKGNKFSNVSFDTENEAKDYIKNIFSGAVKPTSPGTGEYKGAAYGIMVFYVPDDEVKEDPRGEDDRGVDATQKESSPKKEKKSEGEKREKPGKETQTPVAPLTPITPAV